MTNDIFWNAISKPLSHKSSGIYKHYDLDYDRVPEYWRQIFGHSCRSFDFMALKPAPGKSYCIPYDTVHTGTLVPVVYE